ANGAPERAPGDRGRVAHAQERAKRDAAAQQRECVNADDKEDVFDHPAKRPSLRHASDTRVGGRRDIEWPRKPIALLKAGRWTDENRSILRPQPGELEDGIAMSPAAPAWYIVQQRAFGIV